MVLDQVALAHPESRDRLRVTLEKWLQLNVGVTWRNLELAITNANRQCLGYDPLTSSKSTCTCVVNITIYVTGLEKATFHTQL